MTAYKTWVQDILDQIDTVLKADITGSYSGKSIAEISKKVRLNDADYKFPRIDILPVEDKITDQYGIGGKRMHSIGIDVICSLSAEMNDETGAADLVAFVGDVHDSLKDERTIALSSKVDDIYIETIDYDYAITKNSVLYIGRIVLRCEVEEV